MKSNTILGAAVLAACLSGAGFAGQKENAWQELAFFDGLMSKAKKTIKAPVVKLPVKRDKRKQNLKDPVVHLPVVEETIFTLPVVNDTFETPAFNVSSLQGAIGQCLTIMVYNPISTAQDLIDVYGSCLAGNPELKITRLISNPAKNNNLVVLSKAQEKAVRGMSGALTLKNGQTITVEAYPDAAVQLLGIN